MIIKKVIANNFEILSGEWDLPSGRVIIEGRNGSGKSAIGRAIIWAFTGRDVFGDKRTDHIMLDMDEPTEVVVVTDSETIKRRKTRTASTLWVNRDRKSADHFGDPDTWISAFMPGYFLTLPDKDKRRIFLSCLPHVDRAKIFREISGLDPEVYGVGGPEYDSTKWFKRASEKRRTAEAEVNRAEGEIEAHKARIAEAGRKISETKETGEDIQSEIDDAEKEISKLKEQLESEIRTNKEYAQWSSEMGLAKRAIDDAIHKWERAYKAAEEDRAFNKSARDKYEAAKNDLSDCPACGAAVDSFAHMQTEDVKAKILDYLGVGCPERVVEDPGPRPDETLPEIGPEPPKPDLELRDGFENTIRHLEKNISDCKARINARAESSEDMLKDAKSALSAAIELKADAESGLKAAADLEDALHPVRGIEGEVMRRQMDSVRDRFGGNFDIVLEEVVKTTGDRKPIFKVTANISDPKDPGAYRTVPLQYASAGQQISIGLSISDFIDEALDVCGIRWIDNADLLSRSVHMEGCSQIFEARVTESIEVSIREAVGV